MSTRTFTFTVQAAQTGVPAWAPQTANTAAVHTVGGGVLQNTFRSVVAPYYSTFYSIKVINDYSSGIANPHIGTHGGVVFRGGGHSATNDNGTYALVSGASGFTWVRLSNPTPWFGTGTDSTTQTNNSVGNANALADQTYGDPLPAVESEKRPPSSHTYGVGTVIPPSDGGGTYGTFFTVLSSGWLAANNTGNGGMHALPIQNQAGQSGNTWARASTLTAPFTIYSNAPQLSAYVSAQRRTYMVGRNTSTLHWYDHQTDSFGTGGNQFGYNASDEPNNGRLVYIPARNLLVCLFLAGGKLRVTWMDVSSTTPNTGGTAALSADVWIATGWAHADWCPDNNRLLLANTRATSGGASDTQVLTEIEIPTNPASTWTVTRRTFGGQAVTFSWWQRLNYLPALKSLVCFPNAYDNTTQDRVIMIRPFGV